MKYGKWEGDAVEKPDYVAIGARIRSLRRQRGWTQRQLAERCESSLSFQGHIERGSRIPSLETIIKIASLLDVSLDHLIHGLDAPLRSAATRKTQVLTDIMGVLREHIDDLSPNA